MSDINACRDRLHRLRSTNADSILSMTNKGWNGREPYDVWVERKKRKQAIKRGRAVAPPSKALVRASNDACPKRVPGSFGTGNRRNNA